MPNGKNVSKIWAYASSSVPDASLESSNKDELKVDRPDEVSYDPSPGDGDWMADFCAFDSLGVVLGVGCLLILLLREGGFRGWAIFRG